MHSEERAARLPPLLIHYLRTPTYHPVAPRYIKTNTRLQKLRRFAARSCFTWSGWREEAVQLFCRGFIQGRGADAQCPPFQRWIRTERFVLLLGVVIGESCWSGVSIHKNARQLVMQYAVLRLMWEIHRPSILTYPEVIHESKNTLHYVQLRIWQCSAPKTTSALLQVRGRTSPVPYIFLC